MQIDISEFIRSGFDLKSHLVKYLDLKSEELDQLLDKGSEKLSSLHPGSIDLDDHGTQAFYEKQVGNNHLFDLASWHLSSNDYIADTLHLQQMFAHGNVLDFGGGIGTHALAAAALPKVKHVYFVDLNPQNRSFVETRAEILGLSDCISFYRDLHSISNIKFDTLVCLDVLEHLANPSNTLIEFRNILKPSGIALMNWYFFKGHNGEFPFHFDDPVLIENFFKTLQSNFIEVFHPYLITTRAYKLI